MKDKDLDGVKRILKQASEEVRRWPKWMKQPEMRNIYPPDPMYYRILEQLHNRREDDGWDCDHCDETGIDSIHLHHYVCTGFSVEHRSNYDMDELVKHLLGENND